MTKNVFLVLQIVLLGLQTPTFAQENKDDEQKTDEREDTKKEPVKKAPTCQQVLSSFKVTGREQNQYCQNKSAKEFVLGGGLKWCFGQMSPGYQGNKNHSWIAQFCIRNRQDGSFLTGEFKSCYSRNGRLGLSADGAIDFCRDQTKRSFIVRSSKYDPCVKNLLEGGLGHKKIPYACQSEDRVQIYNDRYFGKCLNTLKYFD